MKNSIRAYETDIEFNARKKANLEGQISTLEKKIKDVQELIRVAMTGAFKKPV
jgi:hypothetical protein